MLLRKLMSGLGSVALKEVFLKCEMFTDVDSLRKFCVAFEAAHKDASRASFGGNFGWEHPASAAATTPLPDVLQEGSPSEAAGTRRNTPQPRCGKCGARHRQGKGPCPAETRVCATTVVRLDTFAGSAKVRRKGWLVPRMRRPLV